MHLIDLEARIHALETEYLRETSTFGALVQGLEGYLGANASSTPTPSAGPSSLGRRHASRDIKDTDRIFSNSSSSSQRALAVHSRLVKEGVLAPIPISKSGPNRSGRIYDDDGLMNASSASLAGRRKRGGASDPAWNSQPAGPGRKRQR